MLVLNRKNNEEIRIGGDIIIKIISVSDGNVKLGIDAPAETAILRGELYHNVKENIILASKKSGQSLTASKSFTINKLGKSNNE
ncbi:MAG TPA: carbon storage regulator [Ignavibacteria bacterium]|nr:carbon storage regulator [Ignavibacteria bacterium]